MTDSSGTPIYTARDGRITPEGIAERTFTEVKRGYAESEVRSFLRMVADEVETFAARERDYAARIESLQARLAQPPRLSDQDLIAALGEETARVLGQARESAAELRNKAEEHARRVVREAQESARELRSSTQQAVEARTREAEEAARARARDIVAEARDLRERVLNDLNERRADIERQIGDLRSNRGVLVDVYQLVERTLEQATRTIAQEPSTPPSPAVVPADRTASDADLGEAAGAADRDESESAEESEPPPVVDAGGDAEPAPDAPAERRDVGALFDRIRSGTEADAGGAEAVSAGGEGAVAPDAGTPAPAREADVDTTAASADDAARAARDDALAPITDDLGRQAKRALQDEQNDVLDGLRRQRGKIDARKVLPPADDQLNRWAHVLQPAVDRAYAAGAAALAPAGGPPSSTGSSAPSALLTELTAGMVSPLRERLEGSLASIDARNPADAEIAIAQSLGARYRAWAVRRRAAGDPPALGAGPGGQVPRLRRQRARAHHQGGGLPHRTAVPTRTPGVSLLPRARHRRVAPCAAALRGATSRP
jgi:DivIVA domain-containing protein